MKIIKKYYIQFSLFVFFVSCTSLAAAQHANFTGTWKLNPEKSKYEGLSLANLFDKMVITQNEKQIIIKSLRGETETVATLSLDGTEVKSKIENPSRDRMTYFPWLEAKIYEVHTIDNTGTEIYNTTTKTKLSDDGKTITMVSEIDYKSRGSYRTDLILEKQ